MFDVTNVVPREITSEPGVYTDLEGTHHNFVGPASQNNVIIILATISNNLERIANTQEKMQKQGEEASKKADSTLQAAMGAFQGLKGLAI